MTDVTSGGDTMTTTTKDFTKDECDPFEPLGPEAETIALSTIELPDGRVVGRSQQVRVEGPGVVSFGVAIWMIDGNVVAFVDAATAMLASGSTPLRITRRFKRSVRNWIWKVLS